MSVCLSEVGVLSKRMNESSWFLEQELPSTPPILHCVKRKFGYLQNKGTSLWNFFVPNSGLEKLCFGISIVETCYRLSSRKVDTWSVRDKLDHRRSTTLTLVHQFITVIIKLCLQHNFVARVSDS